MRTFKGTVSEYRAIHDWVRKQLGEPSECENCGATDKTRYHWANLSGEYKRSIEDWARLCVFCHSQYDGWKPHSNIKIGIYKVTGYCLKGHEMTPENTYIRTKGRSAGERDCRKCKALWIRKRRADLRALAPKQELNKEVI